jgi:predicted aspartyl protease
MTTITFPNKAGFSKNRPYADVVLLPKGPSAPTYKCLVDTGADYLQLPAMAAGHASISLSTGISTSVTTVAGSTILMLVKGLSIEIEGKIVKADVLFDPSNTSAPIAGRQVLLNAFDIGFNVSEWLWT